MEKKRTPRDGEEKTPRDEEESTPWNGKGKDSNIRERATNVGWNWSTVVARRLSKLVML